MRFIFRLLNSLLKILISKLILLFGGGEWKRVMLMKKLCSDFVVFGF